MQDRGCGCNVLQLTMPGAAHLSRQYKEAIPTFFSTHGPRLTLYATTQRSLIISLSNSNFRYPARMTSLYDQASSFTSFSHTQMADHVDTNHLSQGGDTYYYNTQLGNPNLNDERARTIALQSHMFPQSYTTAPMDIQLSNPQYGLIDTQQVPMPMSSPTVALNNGQYDNGITSTYYYGTRQELPFNYNSAVPNPWLQHPASNINMVDSASSLQSQISQHSLIIPESSQLSYSNMGISVTSNATSTSRSSIDRVSKPEGTRKKRVSKDGKACKKAEEIYKCEFCQKTFTKKYSLNSHRKTHSTAKPFQCSHCERSFARNHDRRRHEFLHQGIKRFQCGGVLKDGVTQWGCGKRFTRADGLGRHFRTDVGCQCIRPLMAEARDAEETPLLYVGARPLAVSRSTEDEVVEKILKKLTQK